MPVLRIDFCIGEYYCLGQFIARWFAMSDPP